MVCGYFTAERQSISADAKGLVRLRFKSLVNADSLQWARCYGRY